MQNTSTTLRIYDTHCIEFYIFSKADDALSYISVRVINTFQEKKLKCFII